MTKEPEPAEKPNPVLIELLLLVVVVVVTGWVPKVSNPVTGAAWLEEFAGWLACGAGWLEELVGWFDACVSAAPNVKPRLGVALFELDCIPTEKPG